MEEERQIKEYSESSKIKLQIDKNLLKSVDNPDALRAEYRKQLDNPEEFYINYLVDLRMLIDSFKTRNDITFKDVLAADKELREAWDRLAKLRLVSADSKVKAVTDLAKAKADPDKIKELYG